MNQTAEVLEYEEKVKLCIKNQEPEINDNNIWEGDLLGRKAMASDFTKIIETIEQPFVVSIDAPYGCGKTFFMKRWEKELGKKYPTIYFNAWKNDFLDKPLIPFMYHILEGLRAKSLIEGEDSVTPVVLTLLNNGCKWLTKGIVDFKELSKEASKSTTFNSNILDEYKETLGNIEEFKHIMFQLVDKIDGNLYIFVDELERCRPTFAIELLECIKHLFNMPKIVFILGIDRAQLKHTISNVYGQGMDGEGYLKRFIDLELKLPELKVEEFTKMLLNKFKIRHANSSNNGNYFTGFDIFQQFFCMLSYKFRLSLRDVEQCFTEFNIVSKVYDGKFILPPILALLLIVKAKDYNLYKNISNVLSDREKIKSFMMEIRKVYKGDYNCDNLEAIIIMTFLKSTQIQQFIDSFKGKTPTEEQEKELELFGWAKSALNEIRNRFRIREETDLVEFVKSRISHISNIVYY